MNIFCCTDQLHCSARENPIPHNENVDTRKVEKGNQMADDTEVEMATGPIKSPQDFVGGIALLAVAVVAYFAMNSLGSMRGFSFGAGTVPRLFCLMLASLSGLIIFSSFTTRGPKMEHFPWRGPLFIIASVIFFGVAIRTLGLAITGVITVLLAGAAVDDFEIKEGAIFAVVITAFCAILFPFALGQPIPLWPTFLN
jgi:Tripartite tricarboxylate transporter TctB family